MLTDVIFLILFAAAWTLLSLLSWIVLSLRRGARGALWAAPFAWLGGVAGGALVPLVGLDDGVGIGVSMVAALLGSALLGGIAFLVWDSWGLDARFASWSRRRR